MKEGKNLIHQLLNQETKPNQEKKGMKRLGGFKDIYSKDSKLHLMKQCCLITSAIHSLLWLNIIGYFISNVKPQNKQSSVSDKETRGTADAGILNNTHLSPSMSSVS